MFANIPLFKKNYIVKLKVKVAGLSKLYGKVSWIEKKEIFVPI